jgi:hypothetical protein
MFNYSVVKACVPDNCELQLVLAVPAYDQTDTHALIRNQIHSD